MGKYKRAKYRYWLFPFCSDYYTFEGVTFLCASDDMTTKKPQAILDLEKTYNIDIPDLSLLVRRDQEYQCYRSSLSLKWLGVSWLSYRQMRIKK